MTNSRNKLPISFPTDFSFRQRQSHNWWRRNQPFNWRLAKNRTCCKASVFCIRYFRNYLYLHSGKRKFSGTFYSRGRRNRLIKNIYLQKCTAPDKPRTVHFFNFTISQFFKQEFNLFSYHSIECSSTNSCCQLISLSINPKSCLFIAFYRSGIPCTNFQIQRLVRI